MAGDPQKPKDPADLLGSRSTATSEPGLNPAAPSLGTVTRLMFLAGADDALVTRFLSLMVNESAGAARQPPIVELGPALQQAAHSAGVHVAQELVRQIGVQPSAPTSISLAQSQHPAPAAQAPVQMRAPDALAPKVYKPYAISVSGRRTSVTLPLDLIESAHRLLGEKQTKTLVSQFHAATPVARGGARANRSEHVREQLQQAISMAAQHEQLSQMTSASSCAMH